MRFFDPIEQIDYDGSNPREAMEEAEAGQGDAVMGGQADFISRLLGWLVAGEDLRDIGTRALYATSRIRPDIYRGASLAAMMPPSALRQLEADWAQNFPGLFAGLPREGRAGAVRRKAKPAQPFDV